MKIIVCGAGNVGKSIVSYLVLGNNDIVVIDNDANNLNALAKEFDVQPILGNASHPEILERADAEHTDVLVAVTGSDEVNMVACEVGAALFNIPKKIARVDSQDFLNPLWGGLFQDKHIPIDIVISPSYAIAEEILSLLKFPGMSFVKPLLQKKVYLFAFRCTTDSNVIGLTVKGFEEYIPQTDMRVMSVVKENKIFIPTNVYTFQQGDLIYFLCTQENAETIIHGLNMEKSTIEKVLMFGGNDISRYLASELQKDDAIISSRIIEEHPETAQWLAKQLAATAVINGDLMSNVILEEAGLDSCDAAIAVLPHDKDNLLVTLLAKQHHVPLCISLANASFNDSFENNLHDNLTVDGSAVIISSMLKDLRKARIRDAYSLGRGLGEIWEVVIGQENPNADQKIKDINWPPSCRIGLISRQGKLIFPHDDTILQTDDVLIIYVSGGGIKKAEKLFA